jgi:benzoate membrane transport protein
VTAALIALVVGVTSSAALVFAAARAAGANDAELASWMLALFTGMGVTCIGLSLRYRAPIVTACPRPAPPCWPPASTASPCARRSAPSSSRPP